MLSKYAQMFTWWFCVQITGMSLASGVEELACLYLATIQALAVSIQSELYVINV